MFALLLLSAVAGVNAILGGEVRGIQITDEKYICADNCAYRNVYLTQRGIFCVKEEAVVVEDKKFGSIELDFDCKGALPPAYYTERPPSSGEEPRECEVRRINSEELLCSSNRSFNGKELKMVSWKEVEKLQSATSEGGQGTPEENKPAPQKPKQPLTPKQQECADKTVPKFNVCKDDTCRESVIQEFRECVR
ncbi:hypothetical protein VB005_06697 [Metarhizium brunneum]